MPATAYALGEAAGDLAQPSSTSGTQPMPNKFPVKAISSHNGLRATERAYQLLAKGRDTLDAVIAGVSIVEDDPQDHTVGYGGLPNEDGVVELDAAVMHGPTHRAGAVAALRNIKNPARVAQLVLERTDHVLLVGEGALRFAKAHGFEEQNLLTEKARKIWLYWKQTPSTSSRGQRKKFQRPTGTIHCAARNAAGEISCATTTSGLAFKIPGRVGDSSIIGAGLYVDNSIGSCGSTGRGEANLQNLCCFAAVELMRNGASPKEAGMEILSRVAQHTTEQRLLDKQGRPDFGLRFYLLAKDGRHAGVSMWGPADFAVTDKKGSRLEKCDCLYKKAEK